MKHYFKKTLNFIFSTQFLEVAISAIAIFVLVRLGLVKNSQIFDPTIFSTVIIASIVLIVVNFIRKWIYNKLEDYLKLEQNYPSLIKKYSKNELVKFNNNTIPVVKVCDLLGKRIVVEDHKEYFYNVPKMVAENYEELIGAHLTSKVYNNNMIRVSSWRDEGECFKIVTERTTYFDSLVTNRAMDYKFYGKLSVRELYECGPYLRNLEESVLSNHLGFNGMIESSDGYFPLVLRKKDVSIGKKTYGNSIGASLKIKYALESDKSSLDELGIFNSFKNEIKDEIGIKEDVKPEIICAYRDLVEGGKPQLFFYYKSKLTKDEITEKFSYKGAEKKSLSEAVSKNQKLEAAMLKDGRKLVWISKENLMDNTEVFADCINTVLEGKSNTLKMMPSASACMVFLIEYLRKV